MQGNPRTPEKKPTRSAKYKQAFAKDWYQDKSISESKKQYCEYIFNKSEE